jgi:hypothetical protein
MSKFSHKDTKEEKITKKREEGIFVRNLGAGLYAKITNKNPFPLFVIFVPLCSLCEVLGGPIFPYFNKFLKYAILSNN